MNTIYNNYRGLLKSFLFSTATGTLLIISRVIYTKELTFLFLLWNLFLAMVPMFISYYLESKPVIQNYRIKFYALLLIWLLFLPNAPYIITDFFHLYERPGIPQWYDLIIITIFSWNGIIAGFLSLQTIQKIVTSQTSKRTGWIFVTAMLILTGFGVYIGRYLRYNSWDILIMPVPLFKDITAILFNPCENKDAWGMTIAMTFFLVASYLMFLNLAKTEYKKADS
ncbi:MAG: DUF1361 domain-containing protein [Bacteroidales bacterium]|nr:DUF1361 domain-containing protein [Bacteroidales bacterium]